MKTFNKSPYQNQVAQDLLEERITKGGFRCDRCAMVNPLPEIKQDGFRLCRRCADSMSPIEAQEILATDRAGGGDHPLTPLPYPPTSAFTSAPAVTAVSPTSVTLVRSGASQTVDISGVNLTASDTWAASSGSITVTPVVNSATSVTLTISAGVMTAGDYSLTFNGDKLTPQGMLKVR